MNPAGRDSKFREASRIRQETFEEGQRTDWSKCCEYNNKNEDNSLKTLKVKNHRGSSQKLRQPTFVLYKSFVYFIFSNLT